MQFNLITAVALCCSLFFLFFLEFLFRRRKRRFELGGRGLLRSEELLILPLCPFHFLFKLFRFSVSLLAAPLEHRDLRARP